MQGAGNIFFDVSNANFTITAVASPPLVFTDDPLTAGTTVVKAVHLNELRAAIDNLRGRYGLAAYPWTDLVHDVRHNREGRPSDRFAGRAD